ncbi:hypothetical protein [Maridesulfovibrio sp. FT414]|uniref:hypothetical protein n=1 Tax=Maridesulfovibrio sp. FT414 TaxID=2979469 RepID=UPI003D807457
MTINPGYYLYPKHLYGAELPNSGIFTKTIDEDQYYCRIFVTSPNPTGHIEKYFIELGKELPHYSTVRLCNKLISNRKKIVLGYVDNTNQELVENLFVKDVVNGQLSQKQIDYFNDFDTKADASLILSNYDK